MRRSCNNIETVTETILCAKTCTIKWNESPIAKFSYNNFILSDDSTYYDSGNIGQRQMQWNLYCGDTLIYDFGFGYYYDNIAELSNGSTYGELFLGLNNSDILTFVESLPNTIVPTKTQFRMYLDVKDDSGIDSENISNKYYFTI